MTTDLRESLAKTQDQTLEALARAQELSLEAAEKLLGLLPADPSYGLAAALPTAKEAVEASYAFAERLLEQQKDYALKLTELLTSGAAKASRRSAGAGS